MACFSFTTEISEERTLTLPPGSPTGRVTVVIEPAEGEMPTGRRLLAKLHDLQSVIPAREGLGKEQIDAVLENDRASMP
jgi:tRNA(Phe) wybutosine-synthesizing methylase Tyw3